MQVMVMTAVIKNWDSGERLNYDRMIFSSFGRLIKHLRISLIMTQPGMICNCKTQKIGEVMYFCATIKSCLFLEKNKHNDPDFP